MRITPAIRAVGASIVRQYRALRGDPKEFKRWMDKQPGWSLLDINRHGSFKVVYLSRDLVVKFDAVCASEHTKLEANTWDAAPRAKRKFLAQVVASTPGLVVQERVPAACRAIKCRRAEARAHMLSIYDWDANHSHRLDGDVVFFDYDQYGGREQ